MAGPKKPRRVRARRASTKMAPSPVPNDADPQSWLFLNPAGPSGHGTVFGVLRKVYGGRQNSAVEFGRRKMQPIAPQGDAVSSPWPMTAERAEVVLPADAPDALADPEAFLEAVDTAAIDKTLLVYVTLPYPGVPRLHQAWESARAFAVRLAGRGLASLVVMHAPGRVASSNPVHCHLLIAPRVAGGLGMEHGVYDRDLTCDAGQSVIEALWSEHIATETP